MSIREQIVAGAEVTDIKELGIDQWMSDHPEGKKRVAAIQALLPTLNNSLVQK